MQAIRTLLLSGAVAMLNACASPSLNYYQNTTPEADIKSYFTGDIKAWGIVQDRRGRVMSRFDVDMVGTWEGDVGTLQEQFRYYDGKHQQRIWTIRKIGPNEYRGTADDIVGEASGQTTGTAVNWHYRMDLAVGDKTHRIKFDDWMWQMNDGVLINRSYLKKFGFTVAELTLFMQKQN